MDGNDNESTVFDNLDKSPEAYGVPHNEWRPSQYDAFKFTQEQFNAGNKFVIAELPTGVGKSSIATALGQEQPVLVLVHTLSLLDQYAERYGFSIVKGSQEYPCVHPDRIQLWRQKWDRIPMCSDCQYEKMKDCPYYDQCEYILARDTALAARRMGCTYRFAALAGIVAKRAGVVILDEAHSAADEILSMEEIQVHELERTRFDLPRFPFNNPYGIKGKGDVLRPQARKSLATWVESCIEKVNSISPDEFDLDYQQAVKNIKIRLSKILTGLDEVEWFLEGGPEAIEYYGKVGGKYGQHILPGVRLRPLSASAVANRLWRTKSGVLLMSATIGDPRPLATELGIREYEFRSYPHPTPPAYRPVFNLNLPKMIWDNLQADPSLPRKQAQAIIKFINRWPRSWRGLILTNSYQKIIDLRKHLTPGLGHRLSDDEKAYTNMSTWMSERKPGSIAIQTMQGWGHGVDLFGDLARMLVMASVPFKNPTDLYERAKQEVYKGTGEYFWWSCYVSVPQATGRVSRGEQDANGNWMLNVSALADGSALTGAAMRFYPKWFKEALVPFKEL